MRLTRLRIAGLRIIAQAEIEPAARLNVLRGDNGAGKTSILEAIHLLGFGRSFRASGRDALLRPDCARIELFAELAATGGDAVRRLGLACDARQWEARIDGETVRSLADLLVHCPVVCFEPGSHALIAGGSELRRRFLDWGLFHVEQDFLPIWRRYQRAVRQRNALLKTGADDAELQPWETELAAAGERLHSLRIAYVNALGPSLSDWAGRLVPELGAIRLLYAPGWRQSREALLDALQAGRSRYDSSKITVLRGLEAVRKRPACTSATSTTAPACTTWCSRSSTTPSTRRWPATATRST
jgi:DNA replication and repair protein RecF